MELVKRTGRMIEKNERRLYIINVKARIMKFRDRGGGGDLTFSEKNESNSPPPRQHNCPKVSKGYE